MKLSEIKQHLLSAEAVNFQLPDGTFVPAHFHVTEVGKFDKHFIDCGGTVRHEKTVNFQLWEAGDFDHRLAPQKLNAIIALSEKLLGIEDSEIEVEYQGDTIGKYSLSHDGRNFQLIAKQTACLASDTCGTSAGKQTVKLSDLQTNKQGCCTPGGSCC
jgi:hypothetical protein